MIGNIAEDVDVHGPGLGGTGWKAPAEFPTEGKARVDDFAIGFPHVGVGGVYSFQLLRGEAAFGLGAVALEDAWVKVAVAGGFDEAVFNAVVAVALVKDCVIEQLQFRGRQRVLRRLECSHQQAHAPGGDVDLIVSGCAGDDAVKVLRVTLRGHQSLPSTG